MALIPLLTLFFLAIGASSSVVPSSQRDVLAPRYASNWILSHLPHLPLPPKPPDKKPHRAIAYTWYTALGDSWSSGAGPSAVATTGSDGTCTRNQGGYPYVLNKKYGSKTSSFQYVACPGINTTQVEASIAEPAFGTPDFVTIGTGGNDFNWFTELVTICILGAANPNTTDYDAQCSDFLDVTSPTMLSSLHTRLDELIAKAKSFSLPTGRSRKIVITGYAQPYNPLGKSKYCPTTIPQPTLGTGGYADQINKAVVMINNIIKAAAAANAILYADTDAAFSGKRLCDSSTTYFQADPSAPGAFLFHPTTKGYAAMASAIAKVAGFS